MIQKPKGTYDVYGVEGKKILRLEEILKQVMEVYNYQYFRTPIFEASELFHRSVGESTDIVSKETYDFLDRGDRNMTLRPEGTAGAVRSFIENKLYGDSNQPIKAWYYGPMYRYERPQSGRYREFYQFGVEVYGVDDPLMDAEVISVAVNLYKVLGLKGIKVNLNTLGDTESRNNYRNALISHFDSHIDCLCGDCKERFKKNPLRILDCKVDSELEFVKNSPKIDDYLNDKSKEHFENLQKYLKKLDIDYEIKPSLVRGLDYYTHTVFEIQAEIEGFGSQNVICGGGRYNELVKNLGGPDVSGVGFAMGIERLLVALEYEKIDLLGEISTDVYIVPMSDNEKGEALSLTNALRLNGFKVEMDYLSRNLKSNFKQSERLNSSFVILIGEEELKSKTLTVKNNKTKEEYKVALPLIIDFLDQNLNIGECHCGEECHCDDENCNHE